MRLIIGGAYQGKLEYAKHTYQMADGWIDGGSCELSAVTECRGIFHFHEYIKRMMDQNGDDRFRFYSGDISELEQQAERFALWLTRENPEIVIVSDELDCGIVPVEKKDRLWRELVGRVCTCLAAEADEVVRVVCGIGIRLK